MLSPAALIDHTLLKATATSDEIRTLCEEAVEYGFRTVCIPPLFIPLAQELLYGSETGLATVVGFPLGYATPEVKAFETAAAVRAGAGEIDMVVSLAAALEHRFKEVEAEIRCVVAAGGGATIKVILECCYLDDALKAELVDCAVAAGAHFVKTSTGFGSSGATVADVELLTRQAQGRVGVKAAGGIRDWESCRQMLAAGATRIGSSHGVRIMREWLNGEGGRG